MVELKDRLGSLHLKPHELSELAHPRAETAVYLLAQLYQGS